MASLRARLREAGTAFAAVARNAGLRRLALALTGSEVGSWGCSIALFVLVFESGGASALGVLTLVLFLPPGLAAPFTSLLGDRFPRARVMLGADLVRAALWAAAAAMAFVEAPVEALYGVAAVAGIAGTAFRPAQAALLPTLASTPAELTAANVVSSTIESVTSLAGPALAGVVVALTEPGVSFLIAVGTFLWSALLVGRVRAPAAGAGDQGPASPEEREPVVRALAVGAGTVVREGRVRLLVTMVGAQTLVAGSLLVFLPIVALGRLDVGEDGLGSLWSALGVGGVVGAFASAGLVARKRLATPLALSTLLWGVPLALIALWNSFPGALVLLGLIGAANTLEDVAAFTILQRAVPDAVLSRVFGILESVMYGTHALGGILAAALVGAFGARVALVTAGLFLPLVVVLGWRKLLAVDAEAPAPLRQLELLRAVEFLAALPPATLESLAVHAQLVEVPAGSAVFEQGERGDRFYVIEQGTAAVTVDERPAVSLGPGDGFGEIALLRDVPRTATVTAVTDLTLLALQRDEFVAAVTGHAASVAAAGAVVDTRLARPTSLLPT